MKQRTPLARRTPLRAKPKQHTYERPPAPPMDLAAAAVAIQRQRESAAAPRVFTGPVPDPAPRGPKVTGEFAPATRQILLERDDYRCVRCGVSVENPDGYSAQHRINRGQGGTSDRAIGRPSNGVILCGDGVRGCHGWVERNPVAAERAGWAVQSWADPTTVPVLTWQTAHVRGTPTKWRLLDDQGRAVPCLPPVLNDAHHAAKRRKETP